MLGCFKLINSSKSNPPLIADHVHPEHGGLQRPGDASRGRIHALPRPPQGHHTRFVQRCLRQRGCVISASGFTQPTAHCNVIVPATDLAHHLRIRADLEAMVSSGYDASDAGHKTLLLSLMMTACDLSDQGCRTQSTLKAIFRKC